MGLFPGNGFLEKVVPGRVSWNTCQDVGHGHGPETCQDVSMSEKVSKERVSRKRFKIYDIKLIDINKTNNQLIIN